MNWLRRLVRRLKERRMIRWEERMIARLTSPDDSYPDYVCTEWDGMKEGGKR